MSEHPPDYEAAIAELAALVERRRLPSARKVLARVLPAYPDDVDLLQLAAWVEWFDDKPDEAYELVSRILALDPENFEASYLLVELQMERQEYANAETTVLGLLTRYPRTAALYSLYARLMLMTFNTDKAERLAGEALRLDPSLEDALDVHVLAAYVIHSAAEQRRRLEKLLREYPNRMVSMVRLVQSLLSQGKTQQAYALSRDLVRLYPDNEGIVDLARSLKRSSHSSLLPLWPMQKWGWAGSIGLWLAIVFLLRSDVLAMTPLAGHENTVAIVFLVYVVYSWVWPPLLGRLQR